MIEILSEHQNPVDDPRDPTVIKVIGVGGGGGNAVNRMIDAGLQNVEFIAVNTDMQALQRSRAPERHALGTKLTQGLGVGGEPEKGANAALEDREAIVRLIQGSDMIFITAGMGGGTGTGAAPVIAQVARELDILTVAVVTKPFLLEGARKMRLAEEGIARLREQVDTLITIPNQNLLKNADKRLTMRDAFTKADDVLRQGVQGISDMIVRHGEINIDFADVRSIMKDQGDALMGIGFGNGENRAVDAATNAINNQLLEGMAMDGSKGILVNITSGNDFAIEEFQEVLSIITQDADTDAKIIVGHCFEDSSDYEVKVTVVATGAPHAAPPKEAKAEQAASRTKQTEYIKHSDWERLTSGSQAHGTYFFDSALSDDSRLDVPPAVRREYDKWQAGVAGQGNG